MKKEDLKPLFAIFKNGIHKENIRAISSNEAIQKYIIDSGYSEDCIKMIEFLKQYKAEKAIFGFHY